jgi:hypothetical protein
MTDKAAEEEKQREVNTQKLKDINLDDKVIKDIVKNKKVAAKLISLQDMAGGKAEKKQGNMLYELST